MLGYEGLVNMVRNVNDSIYMECMCILYLDKWWFLKIIEYVYYKNELKELCLVVVSYMCKIYIVYFFLIFLKE